MWLARVRGFLWISALLAGLMAAPVGAQDDQASNFSPAEEDAIRQLVRDYLLANPEVLMEAAQVYRERQQEMQQKQASQTLVMRREELDRDPDSPVIGNPDGDVVVVEFFDYRCPYCVRVAEDLREVVEDDGNIRLVMKEFPILGPESMVAARMALAAEKQGKYEELHFAMMTVSGKLTEEKAFKIAEKIDLDMDQLRRDMEAPEIDTMLQRNFALAQALQINGTPAFVIGDEVVRGAIDMTTLREIVGQARRVDRPDFP
jgi:protein-disulfide isomerase